MEPILDVNTYVAIQQYGDLVVFIIMLIGLLIGGYYFLRDKIEDFFYNRNRIKKLRKQPNVFEEFTDQPKSEKERLKDLKEDF